MLDQFQCGLVVVINQQWRTHKHVERGGSQLISSAAIFVQRRTDLPWRVGGRIERRHAYTPNGARQAPLPESMLIRQSDTAFGMTLRSPELTAQGVKNACIVTSIRLRMRMTYSVGAPNGSVHS